MEIKFFKKEKSFKKKDFTFNTNLYWKLAVGGATVIIIVSFIFSYNLFVETNQETELPANTGGQSLININRLDKALNYFSEREQKSAQILNSPAPVVDPSK